MRRRFSALVLFCLLVLVGGYAQAQQAHQFAVEGARRQAVPGDLRGDALPTDPASLLA